MTERRRFHILGINLSTAIAIFGLTGGGLIAWGKSEQKNVDQDAEIKSLDDKFDKAKKEIMDEIRLMRAETRQDIQELRRVILRTR